MRWYEATVYVLEQVGVDATRNPVNELRETDTVILVRTAPMAPSRYSEEGNAFDLVERTFLTKSRKELLEGAAAVRVCGVLYDIVHVAEWQDPIALRVKRSKQWDSE